MSINRSNDVRTESLAAASEVGARGWVDSILASVFSILMIALFSLYVVHTGVRMQFNGDDALWAIMSTVKVTFYIWDQNRFINIFPFLFSFIHDIQWNYYAQAVLYASFLPASIASGIVFAATRKNGYLWRTFRLKDAKQQNVSATDLAVAIGLSTSLCLFIMRRRYSLDFFTWHGGPYAPSFLIGFTIMLLEPYHRFCFRPLPAICVLLTFLSVFLNPSIIVVAIPLLVLFSLNIRFALFYSSIYALAFIANTITAKMAGFSGAYSAYMTLNTAHVLQNIATVLSNIVQSLNIRAAIVLAMLSLAVFLAFRDRQRRPISMAFILSALILMSVGFVVVFSNLEWIRMNGFNYRYFFIVHFTLLVAIGTLVFLVIKQSRAAALCFVAVVSVFLGVEFAHNSRMPSVEEFSAVSPKMKAIAHSKAKLILLAGNYWKVYPATFFLRAQNIDALPVAYRAFAIRDIIRRRLNSNIGATELFCLDATPKVCQFQQLRAVLGNKDFAHFSLAGNCEKGCEIVRASRSYRLGERLSFSLGSKDYRFLSKGWSDGERWGRWVDGDEGDMVLRLNKRPKTDLLMRFVATGFVSRPSHSETKTNVRVNDCLIGELRFDHGGNFSFVLRIPARCIAADGSLRIAFHNLTPVAPKSLGINSDIRRLGIGLVSLRLDPAG